MKKLKFKRISRGHIDLSPVQCGSKLDQTAESLCWSNFENRTFHYISSQPVAVLTHSEIFS